MRRGPVGVVVLAVALLRALPAAAASCQDLCRSPGALCKVSGRVTCSGDVDLGGGALLIGGDGRLTVSPGPITIRNAASAELEPGARIVVQGEDASQHSITIETSGYIRLRALEDLKASIDVHSDPEGGTITLKTTVGDIRILGELDVRGNDRGGTVTLSSSAGNIELGGKEPVKGQAMDAVLTTGGKIDIATGAGTVRIDGEIAATGGNGGEILVCAGGKVTSIANLLVHGIGSGLGGTVNIRSETAIELGGSVDAGAIGKAGEGDGSGGRVTIVARGDVTQSKGAEISAAGRKRAGEIRIRGNAVTIGGTVDGGGVNGGPGGLVHIHGCRLEVSEDGEVGNSHDMTGTAGRNVLQSNGEMKIGGIVAALPPSAGGNRLEYASPQLLPAVTGNILPAPAIRLNRDMTPCLNRDITPCGGEPPTCGNGRLDAREECDDGNTDDCDKCDSLCRKTTCGDGRLDCLEDCDDGNNLSGDCCDAACHAEGENRPCREDADLCTRTQVCQLGQCVGADPIVCPAVDDCHLPGVCNPTTGACSNPAKPDGAQCDDFNACTTTDACSAGRCLPGGLLGCEDGDSCTDDTCDPTAGCLHPKASGLKSVQCVLVPPPGPCVGVKFPARLQRAYTLAPELSKQAFAVTSPRARVKALERRAVRMLKRVRNLAIRAGKKGNIPIECAKAIAKAVNNVLVDVRTRR